MCVCECDPKTSTMRRPRPSTAVEPRQKKNILVFCFEVYNKVTEYKHQRMSLFNRETYLCRTIHFLVWPVSSAHCSCRGLLLHLKTFSDTTHPHTHTHTHTHTHHTHTPHAHTHTTRTHTHTHTYHTHTHTHT